MADFVAVIRRAVDGLANNTPEMRVRVYEKARGAVQRQLENMKPRPSDDMLRRQLEKLDAAIREVEAEHQEALPAEDYAPAAAAAAPAFVQPEPEAVPYEEAPSQAEAYQEPAHVPAAPEEVAPAPVYEEPVAYENQPVHQAERVDEQQLAQPSEVVSHEAAYEQPVPAAEAEPFYHAPAENDADVEPEPLPVQPYDAVERQAENPAWNEAEPVQAEPAHQTQTADHGADPFADDEEHVEQRQSGIDDEAVQQTPDNTDWRNANAANPDLYGQPSSFRSAPQAAPAWPDAPSTAPDVHDAEPEVEQPTRQSAEPLVAQAVDFSVRHEEPEANEAFWAPEEQGQDQPDHAPRQTGGQSFDDSAAADLFSAHFSQEQHAVAEAHMPSVSDLPDFNSKPAPEQSRSPDDLLADFIQPSVKPTKVESVARVEDRQEESDPWNDLEEFIGQDRNSLAAAGAASGVASAGLGGRVSPTEDKPRTETEENHELEELMAAPAARAYRVQPKRKRSFAPLILSILGLLLLGGGGYAVWMNRDALSGVIGTVASTGSPTPQTTPPANQAQQPAQTKPAQPGTTPQQTAGTPAGTTETAGPQKFTQRLLANGSEVDEGTGGPAATAQNQSVAQVSAAAEAAQPATPGQAGPTSTATPPVGTPEQPANTVAAAGDKIFLYEERIGQSSPTAVEGSVSWSLQKENGENGKSEPTVQGRISVPGRGLTALVTFKRNTDPSLPASHLVEFVFSLPPNFEGGSIDNVQRISMKSSEQDRGDPLVAVPAKITADFHMIALNDFPDARARNLDLMKSRDWMDVPLIYGTGRRALLTLQKGEDGRKAFDEATREWQAMAPTQQGQ